MKTCHCCNHAEILPLASGLRKWSKTDLRYVQSMSYVGVAPERVAANYVRATEMISAVCALTFTPAESAGVADVIAVSAPIDGPWNTLALSELPPTSGFDGVLHQWFDNAERLDDGLMTIMFAHEIGHICGLGHLPVGNVMAPNLDPNIRSLQPGDIAEFQARYGPPVGVPGAKPGAPPAGQGPFSQRIAIGIPGVGRLSFDLAISGVAFQPGQ